MPSARCSSQSGTRRSGIACSSVSTLSDSSSAFCSLVAARAGATASVAARSRVAGAIMRMWESSWFWAPDPEQTARWGPSSGGACQPTV